MANSTRPDLAAIKARLDAATPGPWEWYGNTKTNEVYLATTHSGRRFVMDFVRWGMSGAQPRFQVLINGHEEGGGVMRSLSQLTTGDANARERNESLPVLGAKYEASHRKQFTGIGHADASFIAHARQDVEQLVQRVEELERENEQQANESLRAHFEYKQRRNDQHERYDVLHAQFTAAQATIGAECVEHVELNGHIDIAEQLHDWLAYRRDHGPDFGGKLDDFIASLRIVIDQCDRQRRRANWYEAAHDAGKEKLIESRIARALAPAREAAHALANAVTALGLAAPDTPEVLATANPIADAEFKLWSALGIDDEHPAVTESRRATLSTKGPTNAD